MTTIARTLYGEYAWKFQCRAFLHVSRNPDMRRLLLNMLSQIKAPGDHGFSDMQDLIQSITEHLQGKSYFIIIGDLWSSSVWDIISRVFPVGNGNSRIIITTQVEDVALTCCSYYSEYIYEMSPRNDDQSKKLFIGKVFGSEDECPPEFIEVAYEIIRRCGGLPSAIVNIASLSTGRPNLEEWKQIRDSLPSTLRTNPSAEGLKEATNLIYSNLPPHLKTCLLYLNMYPEGYTIRKDELVNQWVAEGFISGVNNQDTEEIAGGYFDQLVSIGMIQLVDTNYNDEVVSCTAHHIVQDVIAHKSMEANFITTVDYLQIATEVSDKVRRLSVRFGGAKNAEMPASIRMSQVRSLLFSGFVNCVSSIVDYGLLRVLVLRIWADKDKASIDLTGIGELFQLRYLKIECNTTVELPAKICGLQYLGTLEIDAIVAVVPSDVGRLENLLHLRLPSDNVMNFGNLTKLQNLHLTCPRENLVGTMEQ